MKKFPLFIIIVIALSAFAAADYYLNDLDGRVLLDLKDQVTEVTAAPEPPEPPAIVSQFMIDQELEGYQVTSQLQTHQIFEKIDLSNINNITITRNELVKREETEKKTLTPLFIYEIRGPADQGSLTYLNVKLQFIAQISATAETINETSEFGQNSFFFNDKNYENTAFLLVQIHDNLFSFQYDKSETAVYNDVKRIIQSLISQAS
ncbi:hypothetical protein JW752_03270 [Candidatus Peregrinibacteria bacterium]|nr:hypothetical protein [Candidatus Peregrinibacteria bacterium]